MATTESDTRHDSMDKKAATPKEVAAFLNCNAETVRRMLKAGTLPGAKLVGQRWRVDMTQVQIALSRGGK